MTDANLQLKGGTTTERLQEALLEREPYVDQDQERLYIGGKNGEAGGLDVVGAHAREQQQATYAGATRPHDTGRRIIFADGKWNERGSGSPLYVPYLTGGRVDTTLFRERIPAYELQRGARMVLDVTGQYFCYSATIADNVLRFDLGVERSGLASAQQWLGPSFQGMGALAYGPSQPRDFPTRFLDEDSVEPMQSGVVNFTGDADGEAIGAVAFPTAFSGTPNVVATAVSPNAPGNPDTNPTGIMLYDILPGSFRYAAWERDDASLPDGSFQWMAHVQPTYQDIVQDDVLNYRLHVEFIPVSRTAMRVDGWFDWRFQQPEPSPGAIQLPRRQRLRIGSHSDGWQSANQAIDLWLDHTFELTVRAGSSTDTNPDQWRQDAGTPQSYATVDSVVCAMENSFEPRVGLWF